MIEKIKTIAAPDHWDCKQPNELARNNAIKVYEYLCQTYKIFPVVISATIEEGIYFRYSLNKTKSLIIEILNDGFVVWLINDDFNKKVISSSEFDDINKLTEINIQGDL